MLINHSKIEKRKKNNIMSHFYMSLRFYDLSPISKNVFMRGRERERKRVCFYVLVHWNLGTVKHKMQVSKQHFNVHANLPFRMDSQKEVITHTHTHTITLNMYEKSNKGIGLFLCKIFRNQYI